METAWFHVMWSTYGTWLPGDPRGFRDHGHRIHSSGDYKHPPPPGEHSGLHEHAKSQMAHDAVRLPVGMRKRALAAMRAHIIKHELDVLALAVCATHVHALGRFRVEGTRSQIGWIKRSASVALRDCYPDGLWGKRSHVVRVSTRGRQRRMFDYIVGHVRTEHAALWTFREQRDR